MQELKILIDLLVKKLKINSNEEEVEFTSKLILASFERLLQVLGKAYPEVEKLAKELEEVDGGDAEKVGEKMGEISIEISSLPDQDKVAEIRAEAFVAVIDETAQNLVQKEIITQEDYDALEKEFAEAVKKADMEKSTQ